MKAAQKKVFAGGSDTPGISDNKKRHDPREVANYFIAKLTKSSQPKLLKNRVTPLALQKLSYIAHALSLLDLHEPLVNESPRIGVYDPYFPSIRNALSYFGGINVTVPIRNGTAEEVYEENESAHIIEYDFDDDETEILDAVWQIYENVGFDCTRLTFLTGGSREEFKTMSHKYGAENVIPNNDIIEIVSARLAASRNSGNHKNNNRKCAA